MYLVYIDGEGYCHKEFLKVFENIDKAIDFVVDTAYEKSEHKFTKEYLKKLLIYRINDNSDNDGWWYVEYEKVYHSFGDYDYASVGIAKIEKGD